LPTSSFQLYQNLDDLKAAIDRKEVTYPFVQKSREAGYDGKGVVVIKDAGMIEQCLAGGCVIEPLVPIDKEIAVVVARNSIEPLVPIDKEIAVVVARNSDGDCRSFEPVEMQFHPTANLVELLFCPAALTPKQASEVTQLARKVIETYQLCGLLAVEFFLTKNGEWLINEVAPRPHNSGHHTIDSCVTSQFQQHLRAILNWPLGDTTERQPAAMINLLGADGHTGPVA